MSEELINCLEVFGILLVVWVGIIIGYGLYNVVVYNWGYEEYGYIGGVEGVVVIFGYILEFGFGWVVMINIDNVRVLFCIWGVVDSYLM